MDRLIEEFESVRSLFLEERWPGAEEGLNWGTAALKVKGKTFVRIREPGVLVIGAEMEEKEALMRTEPDIYFETDHYKGYPALLVRLDRIDREELRDLLESRWRAVATPKMIEEFYARSR